MTATLGVGIYGAGHVSREHIRAYLKNPVIEDDAIGQPVLIEVDYWNYDRRGSQGVYRGNRKATSGSAFLTGGCHAVDAARWLLGSEAVEVTAYSTSATSFFEFDPTIVAIV